MMRLSLKFLWIASVLASFFLLAAAPAGATDGVRVREDDSQAVPSTLSDDEWIRVDESEAKALERGDDSVMDKYYEQQDGQEAAGEAVPQTVVKNPDGCRLRVDDVHRRDSTDNVGYKVHVRCLKQPVGISFSNELQKHIVAFWWNTEFTKNYILTEADLRQSTRRKGFRYTDIDMVCGNQTPSRWRGQTSSAIKASDGYTYYARQLTREKELEDCGT